MSPRTSLLIVGVMAAVAPCAGLATASVRGAQRVMLGAGARAARPIMPPVARAGWEVQSALRRRAVVSWSSATDDEDSLESDTASEPLEEDFAVADDDPECSIGNPTACLPEGGLLSKLLEWQESGVGGFVLLAATAVSLGLANWPATSAAWLNVWTAPRSLAVAGHALSLKGWVNEGLMAIFFVVVGLEIKQELRVGSLRSPKKAILPCIAALGGMLTPMAVFAALNYGRAGGSLAAMAVPMATDIAFAMAIFSLFQSRMPSSSSAFLLTLATVDDLGAILVLATCYASHIAPIFLGGAALVSVAMAVLGRQQASKSGKGDVKLFVAGGSALWWLLLRSGVSADIAGVIVGLCVSTRAMANGEEFAERLISWLSPLATFLIMPTFALANTAVPLADAFSATARRSLLPAYGIAAGLLIGKPIGIFGFTWLAEKLNIAALPTGMDLRHLAVVSVLGAIGFTMCLLLTEVSLPASLAALPKLSVLIASGIASILAAAMMRFGLKPIDQAKLA